MIEDPQHVTDARALVQTYIENNVDPLPENFEIRLLWQIPTEDGWRVYFTTTIPDYNRYLVEYTESTDESVITVIFDGPVEGG